MEIFLPPVQRRICWLPSLTTGHKSSFPAVGEWKWASFHPWATSSWKIPSCSAAFSVWVAVMSRDGSWHWRFLGNDVPPFFPTSWGLSLLLRLWKGHICQAEYLESQMPNSWECYKTCRALQLLLTLNKSVCACARVRVWAQKCAYEHACECVCTRACVHSPVEIRGLSVQCFL